MPFSGCAHPRPCSHLLFPGQSPCCGSRHPHSRHSGPQGPRTKPSAGTAEPRLTKPRRPQAPDSGDVFGGNILGSFFPEREEKQHLPLSSLRSLGIGRKKRGLGEAGRAGVKAEAAWPPAASWPGPGPGPEASSAGSAEGRSLFLYSERSGMAPAGQRPAFGGDLTFCLAGGGGWGVGHFLAFGLDLRPWQNAAAMRTQSVLEQLAQGPC